MNSDFPERILGFLRRANDQGWSAACRRALKYRLFSRDELLPLARANPAGLFAVDVGALHAQEKEKIRSTSFLMEASRVEESYPQHIEYEGRILRYAHLPAAGESKGFVVLFHGHDAFLHLGPLRPWRHFDLLAPWDTFGYKRQGSWFWGENGKAFVETLVQELIRRYRKKRPSLPWFATGASMGGFGAIWHGIKFNASGIYAQCPQIDLAKKIEDFGNNEPTNPYRNLRGEKGTDFPDLLSMAHGIGFLPPLFLIQNQFDHVNSFAEHAWRLLELYNQKRAWYGLRVHPSIGHGGDGSQEEAELFFLKILEKSPPKVFPAP